MTTTTKLSVEDIKELASEAPNAKLYLYRETELYGEKDCLVYCDSGRWADAADRFCPDAEPLSPAEALNVIRASMWNASNHHAIIAQK